MPGSHYSLLDILGLDSAPANPCHIITPDAKGELKGNDFDKNFSADLNANFHWLINFCLSKDLAQRLLYAAKADPEHKLEIKSDSGNLYRCILSFASENTGKNVLLFQGEPSFLLVQAVTACDYLLFPSLEVLVKIAPSHVTQRDQSGELLNEVYSWLGGMESEDFLELSSSFTGVI